MRFAPATLRVCAVEDGEALAVGVCVGSVGRGVGWIERGEVVGDCLDKCGGVAKREPHVFVGIVFVLFVVMLFVVVFLDSKRLHEVEHAAVRVAVPGEGALRPAV